MFHVTVFWIEEKGPYHLGYIVCTQRQKVMIIITTMPFKLKGLSGWSFKRLLFSTTVYLYLYMYVCMVKNKFIITSSFSKCYSKLDLISVGNRQCFLFWHIRNRWRVSKPSGKNFEVALMGKKKKKSFGAIHWLQCRYTKFLFRGFGRDGNAPCDWRITAFF